MSVNLVTKNTVTLTWEPPKNDGGSPVTHYIIERLSWDTSGKEKETWKQCNKRDVEELTFVVEDLKEVSPAQDAATDSVRTRLVRCKSSADVTSTPRKFHERNESHPVELDSLLFDLQGGEYEFRVKAVNAAGPSRPSATAGPLVIKDQTCE